MGGFLSLLSDFCLARGAAVLGVENLILFPPPPHPPGAGLEWSLGCPSTLNKRRMCVDTALQDEDIVLKGPPHPPSCDLAVAVVAGDDLRRREL